MGRPKFTIDDIETPDVYGGDGEFDGDKVAKVAKAAMSWPPEQRRAMLEWLEAASARERIRRRYANAAELAASVDPMFRVTPMITRIAEEIEKALTRPNYNLIITGPPQEGKSTVSVIWGAIRAWQLDPNRKIILSAYADSLAERHSAEIRGIIESHGAGVVDSMTGEPLEDRIGLKLAPKNRRVSSWGINGSKGGLVAVGLGSGITGRHADVFLIDDPYKNIAEADSASHRRKIDEWMAFVVVTRLAPGANIILNQTRWNPAW